MKQRDFIRLALAGISTGIIVSGQLSAATPAKPKTEKTSKIAEATKTDSTKTTPAADTKSDDSPDPNDGNLGYHVMTEDELLLELSPEGTAMYNKLSPDGKGLALLVASARCDKTNECKGLNACKTDKNDCAGKGACKGQGKCALSSKDLAVKLVYDKMGAKRANLNTPKPAK